MLSTILLIVVILLLISALPTYPYSSRWGYYPSSTVGVVLLILLILMLFGQI
jgi:bacteriorhodopsin